MIPSPNIARVGRANAGAPVGTDERYRREDGHGREMGQGAHPEGSQEPAESGSGEASEAPGRMEGGHDRTPVSSLDNDGLSVHRDVQPTVRRPEKHEGWHE